MGEGVFFEFAAILGIAVAVSALGMALRQPLIVSFLATGILTGPVGLSIVESTDQLELLASIGISILLFVVGLRLDLRLIRTTGPVALATGLGQVVFTSAIGFVIALAMGFTTVGSLYIATTLTFFEHDHHRQAPLRQAGDRLPPRAHRGRLPDRAGHHRDHRPHRAGSPRARRRRRGRRRSRHRADPAEGCRPRDRGGTAHALRPPRSHRTVGREPGTARAVRDRLGRGAGRRG